MKNCDGSGAKHSSHVSRDSVGYVPRWWNATLQMIKESFLLILVECGTQTLNAVVHTKFVSLWCATAFLVLMCYSISLWCATTTRLTESFEGLNSAPMYSVPELCIHKDTCELLEVTWQ